MFLLKNGCGNHPWWRLAANIMLGACHATDKTYVFIAGHLGAGEAFHVDQTTDNHLKSEKK